MKLRNASTRKRVLRLFEPRGQKVIVVPSVLYTYIGTYMIPDLIKNSKYLIYLQKRLIYLMNFLKNFSARIYKE